MRVDLRGVIGLALSAGLLWWTLRDVSLATVADVLRQSNALLFAASTITATTIFPLRARRWASILEPVAGRLPFSSLWRATAIGMMANNMLPARLGEVARAFALTRYQPEIPFGTSIASLAVDRLFDAIVLLALMFVAVLDPAFPADARIAGRTLPQLASGGVVLMVVLLVGLYAAVVLQDRAARLAEALVRPLSASLAPKVGALARAFVHGLAVLRAPSRFLGVLGWALAHWLVHAVGLWLAFKAVGIDAPFSAALFLQGVLGIAVAIPSSPGFFGVFEFAAQHGLAVYGVPAPLAVSWAIGYHLLSFIPITVMGAVYFARLGLSVSDLRRSASPQATDT
jgi:glycosyltransferase 2 family protein